MNTETKVKKENGTAGKENLPATKPPALPAKVPSLSELMQESEEQIKDNALMVLLNQEPPKEWLKEHPMIAGHKYLPINRVEYLLSRIFTKWWVEVRSTSTVANAVAVTVRLYVINPVTRLTEWQEGVGAAPIQTDKGKGAMEWNFAKSDGVTKALPTAESYAIKDAAEKFGKLFGKDLGRKDVIVYDSLLHQSVDETDLKELLELKQDKLRPEEVQDAWRIINGMEKNSYQKLFKKLQAL